MNTEQHSAIISHLSHDGRGIAYINNKITFIKNALPQEKVLFRYIKQRSRFDEGVAIGILEPSPVRVTPRCPHFGMCGGCQLQHLSPAAQRQHKHDVLLEQLKHAGITPENILAPKYAHPWGYRRKARLGVKYMAKKNKVLVGFREENTRYLADLNQCEVLDPSIGHALQPLSKLLFTLEAREHIPQIEIAIGNEKNRALIVRHMVTLNTNDLEQLINFCEQHQYQLFLQAGGPETVQRIFPVNAPELSYQLAKQQLTFEFKPTQFIQVNAPINEILVETALELLDVQPTDRVLDLFCGIGNFTLPIAQRAQQVVGVEGATDATNQAMHNAKLNKLSNVEFHVANLFDSIANAPWAHGKFDKILLDPPRAGAQTLMRELARFNAKNIVYISCNLMTLIRDLKELTQNGYTLTSIGIADMFTHTEHAEVIALCKRSN